MVWPTAHTNHSPERSFSKTPFKTEDFENAGLSFSCGQKIMRFLSTRSLFEKKNDNRCIVQFLWCSVHGKHLMRLQSETSILKLLRGSGDRGLKSRQILLTSSFIWNGCNCYTIFYSHKHRHQQQRQVKQIQNVGFTRLVAFDISHDQLT